MNQCSSIALNTCCRLWRVPVVLLKATQHPLHPELDGTGKNELQDSELERKGMLSCCTFATLLQSSLILVFIIFSPNPEEAMHAKRSVPPGRDEIHSHLSSPATKHESLSVVSRKLHQCNLLSVSTNDLTSSTSRSAYTPLTTSSCSRGLRSRKRSMRSPSTKRFGSSSSRTWLRNAR